MKKFFLSVAVMLAAVSMNANAMSDSYFFHTPIEELTNKYSSGVDARFDLMVEMARLVDEAANELGNDNDTLKEIYQTDFVFSQEGFVKAVNLIQQLKLQCDVQASME